MTQPRLLFLVGFMGSGKSTIGRLLARETGRDFVDTDELVEVRDGRPISRIFEESGEGWFRRVEQEALESLAGSPPAVVSTGGGLFLGVGQRSWMRDRGLTIWLDAPLAVCRARVGEGAERPLWRSGDPVGLRALFEKRRAVYALAAARVLAGGAPEDVLERIRARLPAIFR